MEQIKTIINKNSTKEFIHGMFIFALFSLIVGLAMLGLYITFGVINNSWFDVLQIILLIIAILILFFGGFVIFRYFASLKKMDGYQSIIIYDFLDDYVSFDIYRNEEVVESGKVYYQDFLDYKETKSFIYLRLKNNTWLAIKKEEGLLDFIINKGISKYSTFKVVKK